MAKEKEGSGGRTMKTVPVIRFGKDHWSTFAYIETCCVDNGGRVDLRRMRCNPERHPGLAGLSVMGMNRAWEPRWGTRLKEGIVADHDDHDCADDLEAAGLLENIGSGINPAFRLTAEGFQAAGLLRQHKAAGGSFSTFTYDK